MKLNKKKFIITAIIFFNFYNCYGQHNVFSLLPAELKVRILCCNIKNIIKSNNKFSPLNKVNIFLNIIAQVDKDLNSIVQYIRSQDIVKKIVSKVWAKKERTLDKSELNSRLKCILEDKYNQEKEETAAQLIIAGADPNLMIDQDCYISILIFIAIKGSFKNLINLLIDYGADINVVDSKGMNALMISAFYNYEDIVEVLLETKIDINAQEPYYQKTALMLAVQQNNENIVNLLIKKRANTNIQNKYGNTALIEAVYSNNINLISLLLANGASFEIKNCCGKTAYDIAFERNQLETVELMRQTCKLTLCLIF
ncbi:ankyrin repeat domain-containing protein [Candidatus Babela massiliensis]|uniref:Ankyrin repeats containing protein n=1 Tax=Candidatus Babela massiliensis TaxID=673862 RepID=V6DF11_9BACT|nr:ankyrin repeat domain-containing protein [Candidatus Babela massiliensis]CDK30187.1 Ankyrin repeats containing protein [Candidatus Babela massiliensis]